MEFQTLFPVLRNRLSDGLDVPQYIRDLFAQITEVSEAEWGTPKDPSSRITKETTLRSYAKRGLTAKFAQSIVYRLTPDNLSDRINERPLATRQLLAADLVSYAPQVNADNVGNVVADTMVDIIRRSAGCVPLEELEAEKQRELFADLKSKFGDFLYEECDGYCPFPGCGKRLSVSTGSQISRVFDVSLVDKKKKATVTNLVALCPMCHATYQMDNSPAKTKELASVKALLSAHEESTRLLDITSGKVAEVYFTGMFTANQGDFSVHYYDPESGRIRQYYPDFLAKMVDGSYQLIEVKGDNKIDDTVVKAKQAAAEEMAVASGVKYLMYAGSRIVSTHVLEDDGVVSQQGRLV